MNEAKTLSQPLVASDLMSATVLTITADTPLKDAAMQLVRAGVHGAPIVEQDGRCVGVLSVSDLARWAAGMGKSQAQRPRTCAFQEKHREPGGQESTRCLLAEGTCPFQRPGEIQLDGTVSVLCSEPNNVLADWQMVELESIPGDAVRDFMTTEVVTTAPDTSVSRMARLMLDRGVHRLLILDSERRPVGIVSANDLLQVLAHPEFTMTGGEQE
ncbi:MAG: CBS domain-containing protein [Planctomycetia bacterium]|nr:CBS domain-containing protein [Planctomycetia bacterium]